MNELEVLRATFGTTPSLDPIETADRRETLVQHILESSGMATAGRGRSRRIRWIVVGAGLPLGAMLAAAGWASRPREATSASGVLCSIEGDLYGIANAGETPTDACARTWVEVGAANDVASVPPLIVCVYSEAGTSMLEVRQQTSQDTCVGVGYSPWLVQDEHALAGEAVAAALDEVGLDRGNPTRHDACVSESDLAAALGRQLEVRGLSNWGVVTENRRESTGMCFHVRDTQLVEKTVVIWNNAG